MKRLIAALLVLSLSLAAVPQAQAFHGCGKGAAKKIVRGATLPLRLVKKLCHRG